MVTSFLPVKKKVARIYYFRDDCRNVLGARYSMYLCRVPAVPLHMQPEFQSHIIYTSHEHPCCIKMSFPHGKGVRKGGL